MALASVKQSNCKYDFVAFTWLNKLKSHHDDLSQYIHEYNREKMYIETSKTYNTILKMLLNVKIPLFWYLRPTSCILAHE